MTPDFNPSSSKIAPGVRFGAYRVDSLLGSGGMASVYLVFHEGLGRYEAMKVLPHHLSYDRNFSARFLTEARTAAKLRHGGIATIFSVSDPTESEPYFTMQYIQGRDLSKVIEVEGQMSLSRTVLILRQVAEALDYAHSQGVIHRDVKPGNVLLEEDGKVRAYVVDFGIARAQESEPGKGLTQTGMIVGTPEYMSPEQAGSGSPVGAASDQYGLAAVAYEMLCGRSPFGDSGSSTMQILTSHLNKTPETPRRLRADLPSATSNAILKALSKNPSDRFPSCTDFVNSLEGKVPVTVPRSSSGTKPFATVAAVLIGLLGVGLVGMALTRSSPPPTPAPLSNPVNPSDTTGTSGTTGVPRRVDSKTKPPTGAVTTPIEKSSSTGAGGSGTDGATAPEQVLVPNLLGETQSQAAGELRDRGFSPRFLGEASSSIAKDSVMSQEPSALSKAKKGEPIRVVVSTGPPPPPAPISDADHWSLSNFSWKPPAWKRDHSVSGGISEYRASSGESETFVQEQRANGRYEAFPEATDRRWRKKAYHGYTCLQQEETTYAGVSALRWEYLLQDNQGVLRHHKNYYFNSGNRGYAITVICPAVDWATHSDELEQVLNSFKLK